MTQEIYFLSIFHEYVSMIIHGEKQWEFRANPRFGMHENGEIQINDILFLVSVFKDTDRLPEIQCLCKIVNILRKQEMEKYFSNKVSGHWKEAGCSDDSERDWDFFKNNILDNFSTAIRLEVQPIQPAVKVSKIIHKTKLTPWSGTGFTPVKNLKRFSIGDKEVVEYLRKMIGE